MSGTKKSGRRDHSIGKPAGRTVKHLARDGWKGQKVFVQRMIGDEPQPIQRGEVLNVAGGKGEPRVLTIFVSDELLTITFLQDKTNEQTTPTAALAVRRN